LYNPIGVKSQYAATTLPKELARAMTKQHDAAVAGGTMRSADGLTRDQVREQLGAHVSQFVAKPGFGSEWKLKSFGECTIAEQHAAQMIFENNGQFVSVISLPSKVVPEAPDLSGYTQLQDGHPMSGFIKGAGMHCVIGSAGARTLSLEDVEGMRNDLEAEPTTHPCESTAPVAMASPTQALRLP